MVKQGFLEAGYNHVNVDDCWPAPDRLADGSPTSHTLNGLLEDGGGVHVGMHSLPHERMCTPLPNLFHVSHTIPDWLRCRALGGVSKRNGPGW